MMRAVLAESRIASVANRFKRRVKQLVRYFCEPHVGRAEIRSHLNTMGIQSGDALLVHSSLSAFGYIPDGTSTVIEAIVEHIGHNGLVVFPAHTFRSVNRGSRHFDVRRTPSEVGSVAEAFRMWPGAIRSLHPSHSVCAIGKSAQWFVDGHLDASSPCGAGSPYAKLMELGGKILLFGVGLERNTCFHSVEAMAGVPYLMKEQKDRFTIVGYDDKPISTDVHCHARAVPSRFADFEQPLHRAECLVDSRLGRGRSMTIDASRFRDLLVPTLKQFPELLLSGTGAPVALGEFEFTSPFPRHSTANAD